jgi:hypothetical protein
MGCMSREKLGAAAGRFAATNNMIPSVFTDIDLFRISMRSIYEKFKKRSHLRQEVLMNFLFEPVVWSLRGSGWILTTRPLCLKEDIGRALHPGPVFNPATPGLHARPKDWQYFLQA